MLKRSNGFTIVELLIVIVVIGILSSITIVAFNGVARKAIDTVVKSDGASLAKSQALYGIERGEQYASWYSANAAPAGFTTSLNNGNTADIVTSSDQKQYCIRIYNAKSSYGTLDAAYTVEQPTGACATLAASSEAIAAAAGPVTSGWKAIGAMCAIRFDDKTYCWGYNPEGQLGNGTINNSGVPVPVTTTGALSGKTVKSVASHAFSTCVTASDDNAYCWGNNVKGQLGNGTTSDSTVPVAVSKAGVLSGKTIKTLSTNAYIACAVASDDKAYCWGDNFDARFGNGTSSDSSFPVAVSVSGLLSGKTVTGISVGNRSTCTVTSESIAYCWGNNTYGQLANGNNITSSVPVAVSTAGALSGKTVKAVSTGNLMACAIASDNNAYCWGYNALRQLGNGTTTDSNIPVAVSTAGVLAGKTLKSISVGGNVVCAVASDNNAYCWGNNIYGQLGNGTTTNSAVPVAVTTSGALSGKTIKSITVGNNSVCAVASNNSGYCWGANYDGQLGNNTYTDSNVPVLVTQP